MTTELYTWQFCPFAQRARIALIKKGVDYVEHEVDITRPYPERFLALNPNAQVPTLIVDGAPLWESEVVCEFIDEGLDGPSLLPADNYRRGVARLLIDYGKSSFIPALYRLLLNQDLDRHDRLRERSLDAWRRMSLLLERFQTGERYLYDEPCLVEYAFGPFFQRWDVCAYYRDFSVPQTDEFAAVKAWREACLSLDLVRDTAADRETLIKVYADYARGYDNAKLPEGREISAFDVEAWPPEDRDMPPPGLRAATKVDERVPSPRS